MVSYSSKMIVYKLKVIKMMGLVCKMIFLLVKINQL